MPPSETAGFDLTFEGLVAAHAEPDVVLAPEQIADLEPGATWPTTTLRINGDDVILALCAATNGLREPIRATVSIDGKRVATGRLHVDRGYTQVGCGDPFCCGGFSDNEIRIGDTDVLALLEQLHGGEHEVWFTGQGWVVPDVDVTFAHHTAHVGPGDRYVTPGERLVLPLDVASKLKYRVTTASRDRIEKHERAHSRAFHA